MRAYNRLRLKLSKADENAVREILHGGIQQVQVVVRSLALLRLSAGDSAPTVARALDLNPKTVRDIGKRYLEGGLNRALYDRPRPGAQRVFSPAERQRIIAMVCGDPPDGQARWSIRLIAQEAIKRKLVPRIGRESIRVLLESHDLKPWREKNVVRRRTR